MVAGNARIDSLSTASRRDDVAELWSEYVAWVNSRCVSEYNIEFDVDEVVTATLARLGEFLPPQGGRLLLVDCDGELAGCGGLHRLEDDIGEIKRMYVRLGHRGTGLGRMMLEELIREAGAIGYRTLRLDSAGFMTEAHTLYESAGFRYIEPYPGTEIEPQFQALWKFMELSLADPRRGGAGAGD